VALVHSTPSRHHRDPVPACARLAATTGSEQLLSAVQQSGSPHLDSLVHLVVGGSELHGAKVKDTDDLDIYGACIWSRPNWY
jgi:hypothetical protein